MFTRDDARWLSDIVGAFYAARTPAQLASASIAMAHERFRAIATACEELTVDNSRYIAHGVRSETPVPADYTAYIHDNPTFPVLRSGRGPLVMRLSAIVSRPVYERTDHFNGIARPVGFRDQLLAHAPSGSGFFCFGLFRDRLFTDDEHELMQMVQPHLHAAWHRVQTPAEHLPGGLRLELSPGLLPRQISAVQRMVLRAYFPNWRDTQSLPIQLREWLECSLTNLRNPLPERPLRAFVVDSARGRLFARCFPSGSGDSMHLILVETPANPDYFGLRCFGLTSRECEILHWIAQGKRDAEIAVIVGCAADTVSKHVEHLLAKLHAKNRATAVDAARRWLQS